MLASILLFSVACARGDAPPSSAKTSAPAPSSASAPGPAASGPAQQAAGARIARPLAEPVKLGAELSRAEPEHLVAIGDLHGDLAATRRALRLAGAIDASDHWIGGRLVVVQTGDLIDRGNEDREVLELLERVQAEAADAGGELIVLNGNHEVMNVAADFRYVTATSFGAFSREGGREAAFAPGGPFARILAEHPLLVKVGHSVFVHGGILPKHVDYGLDRMNEEVQAWMRGELPTPPAIVVASEGVVWTRAYGLAPESCDLLRATLAALGASRLVVGHTVQAAGITSACEGRVWRIDTGLSAYYGGPTEVLEINEDTVRVRRSD